MSSFHLTVGDNIRALRDWHTKAHNQEWHECPWAPCDHLEKGFREAWTK